MGSDAKIAVISGGGSGIGAAIGRTLSEAGMAVVLVGRNKDRLQRVSQYLQAEGGQATISPCDITREKDLQKLASSFKNSGAQIELLINNAGIAKTGTIRDMAYADWKKVIDTNLNGAFLFTQYLLPFVRKEYGQVLFINSVAGKQSFAKWSAYNASKAGLKALADTLRQELAADQIRVTSIFPAAVDTPIHDSLPYDWDRSKMMRADDVARTVLYCYKQAPRVSINEIDLQSQAGTF